jgi:hypothetical protein
MPDHIADVARATPVIIAATVSVMSVDSKALPADHHLRHKTALLFGGVVGGIIALHLATNSTLGFHTDELYYLDSGRHLAFGYVDFPPIVPLLARLETGLIGVSRWDLRLLPTVLGGFMVALSGLYVRRLGGSLRLQGLALLAAVAAPYFLGANWVFQTVTFDEMTGMVAPLLVPMPRRRPAPEVLDLSGHCARYRSGGQVHHRRPHTGHRHLRRPHPFAAGGAADPIPLDRRRSRFPDLGAKPRLTGHRGLSLPRLHHQPTAAASHPAVARAPI